MKSDERRCRQGKLFDKLRVACSEIFTWGNAGAYFSTCLRYHVHNFHVNFVCNFSLVLMNPPHQKKLHSFQLPASVSGIPRASVSPGSREAPETFTSIKERLPGTSNGQGRPEIRMEASSKYSKPSSLVDVDIPTRPLVLGKLSGVLEAPSYRLAF
jgi:hypothetical protein